MNEQILKDLAEQAGFDVKILCAPYPGGWPREDMLALESFAQLIVEECLHQVDQAIPDTNCSAAGTYKTARIATISRIKKHFGIEE
jgi:hypothetical protein